MKRILAITMTLCILLSAICGAKAASVDAAETGLAAFCGAGELVENGSVKYEAGASKTVKVLSARNTVEDILMDISDETCRYLYSPDGSRDFIYSELEGGGYVVFLSDTLEMLEYSPYGAINYPEEAMTEVYCGPGAYYTAAQDGVLTDVYDGQEYVISPEDASAYSESLKDAFSDGGKKNGGGPYTVGDVISLKKELCASGEKSVPPFSDDGDLYVQIYDFSAGTYIKNYQYFLVGPKYGHNTNGCCGTVAAQILLSYHNYYSDRRIIQDRYLNGDSSEHREDNPNYCADPAKMSYYTLGSRGDMYDGSDDSNSYFAKVYDAIGRNTTPKQARKGIEELLRENGIRYEINQEGNVVNGFVFGCSVSSEGIIRELDAGRPVFISMQKALGGSNHAAVAYGYCDYTYSGSYTGTYSGFVVDGGHRHDRNLWTNEKWNNAYITLNIDHEHSYDVCVGEIEGRGGLEYKCSVCGHRTDRIVTVPAGCNYTETVKTMRRTATYNYTLRFAESGPKVIQTFGGFDTDMVLTDSSLNILALDDDGGYIPTDDEICDQFPGLPRLSGGIDFKGENTIFNNHGNALISYDFVAGRDYYLFVNLKLTDTVENSFPGLLIAGNPVDVKISITAGRCLNFGSLGKATEESYGGTVTNRRAAMFVMTPSYNAYVKYILTSGAYVNRSLYIINPASTELSREYTGADSSDRSLFATGHGGNTEVIKRVEAGKDYFVVVTYFNRYAPSGWFKLNWSRCPVTVRTLGGNVSGSVPDADISSFIG